MDTNSNRMPKGINKQTPRANRAVAQNKTASATLNQSTPTSRPAVAATPASSSEPAPARQSTPPASQSPVREPAPASRPAAVTPVVPLYKCEASPKDILGTASILPKRDAKKFLLQEMQNQWWPHMIERLQKEEWIDSWIEKYSRAETYLEEFSFDQWASLDHCVSSALKYIGAKKQDRAFSQIQYAENQWTSPADKRGVRYWVLGQIWFAIKNIALGYDQLLDLITDFGLQPESERNTLRQLWHSASEQARFDSLPAELLLFRGGLSGSSATGVHRGCAGG